MVFCWSLMIKTHIFKELQIKRESEGKINVKDVTFKATEKQMWIFRLNEGSQTNVCVCVRVNTLDCVLCSSSLSPLTVHHHHPTLSPVSVPSSHWC